MEKYTPLGIYLEERGIITCIKFREVIRHRFNILIKMQTRDFAYSLPGLYCPLKKFLIILLSRFKIINVPLIGIELIIQWFILRKHVLIIISIALYEWYFSIRNSMTVTTILLSLYALKYEKLSIQ
jgi:hypothetical protein